MYLARSDLLLVLDLSEHVHGVRKAEVNRPDRLNQRVLT